MPLLALLGNKFVILGVAFALLAGWGGWQKYQRVAVEQEFAEFRNEVAAAGIAAEKAKIEREALDRKNKEDADASNAKAIADATATISRLRSQINSSRGFVPPAPATSTRPDLACFDRAELERANRELVEGVRAGADEGTTATLNLNTAKRWALRLSSGIGL